MTIIEMIQGRHAQSLVEKLPGLVKCFLPGHTLSPPNGTIPDRDQVLGSLGVSGSRRGTSAQAREFTARISMGVFFTSRFDRFSGVRRTSRRFSALHRSRQLLLLSLILLANGGC